MRKDLEKNIKERLGEIKVSNEGYEMKIVEYKDVHNIIIEFQDEYKAKIRTQYSAYKNGSIKNPYHPNVCRVGYLGQGKYKPSINGKKTKCYKTWQSMLERCYDPYIINKNLTYKDCFVCEEWHNFQNFAKWFYKHYYEIEGERMCLDKDILFKNNKIYSPETCMIVPERINMLFIKSDKSRGDYPIGVCWHKNANKFMAYCQILNKNNKTESRYLGLYKTSKEAFLIYKQFKENYIKQIADEYKDLIPKELYNAMHRYEVEIDD